MSNQVEIIYSSGRNSKETGEIIRISPRKSARGIRPLYAVVRALYVVVLSPLYAVRSPLYAVVRAFIYAVLSSLYGVLLT